MGIFMTLDKPMKKIYLNLNPYKNQFNL